MCRPTEAARHSPNAPHLILFIIVFLAFVRIFASRSGGTDRAVDVIFRMNASIMFNVFGENLLHFGCCVQCCELRQVRALHVCQAAHGIRSGSGGCSRNGELACDILTHMLKISDANISARSHLNRASSSSRAALTCAAK